MIGALTGAIAVAAVLHLASGRADAAMVVPLAWAWGGAAVLAAWRMNRAPLWSVLALAVAARGVLVGTPPLLSDDVYRYAWEGLAVWHGVDIWQVPPADVVGLDDGLRGLVNHNHMPSIYPSLAVAWFAVLGGSIGVAQATAALADVATVGAIAAWDPTRRWPAVLYALHPLAALESAQGAHVEALAIAATAWAVVWLRRRPAAGAALLAAGIGLKLFPVTLLPSLWRRPGVVIAGGVALCAAAAPLWWAPSAETYATSWSFNGAIYPWLPYRPLLALAGALVVLATVRLPPHRAWLWIGAAFAVLTPTAHPWYLLWAVVPGLFVGRWAWAVGGIGYLGAYAVLATLQPDGSWTEAWWLPLVSWGPVAVALAAEEVARRVR